MPTACEFSRLSPSSQERKGTLLAKLAQTYRAVGMAAVGEVSKVLLFVWTNNIQCQHSKKSTALNSRPHGFHKHKESHQLFASTATIFLSASRSILCQSPWPVNANTTVATQRHIRRAIAWKHRAPRFRHPSSHTGREPRSVWPAPERGAGLVSLFVLWNAGLALQWGLHVMSVRVARSLGEPLLTINLPREFWTQVAGMIFGEAN
jgi:hypothetical protein